LAENLNPEAMTKTTQYLKTQKALLMIIGIIIITIGVIGYRLYTHSPVHEDLIPKQPQQPILTMAELPAFASTSTEAIRQMLDEAFVQGRLITAATYPIPNTSNALVLAAPGFANSSKDATFGCDLQDNPYCGLYLKNSTGTHLVIFGSKLAGFIKVERFIDADHAQILTSWTLFNFTSTDRKQLNLQTGELIPLLITETDQDDRSATLNVSGYGDVLTVRMIGTSIGSRLTPDDVDIQDQTKRTIFKLSDKDVVSIQQKFENDADRKLRPIQVIPTDDDVVGKTLRVELYGVPFKLDLQKKTMVSI